MEPNGNLRLTTGNEITLVCGNSTLIFNPLRF